MSVESVFALVILLAVAYGLAVFVVVDGIRNHDWFGVGDDEEHES